MMKKSNDFCTIEGFESMTAQEVFNISALHLMKQAAVSSDGAGCAYRGYGGLMCAAGPFLRDEDASRYEGRGWETLVKFKVVPEHNLDLIVDLQHIHDSTARSWYSENPALLRERWKAALTGLAYTYDLTMPEIPAYK